MKMKRVISAMLTLVMLISTMVFVPTKVEAYTPHSSLPDSSNNYYYAWNPFYQYGFGLPNCTCYAFGRAYEVTGQKPNLSWGDAGQWYQYNIDNGFYPYGSIPMPGAIACWSGHVAFVEDVTTEYITFSESHWGGYPSSFDIQYMTQAEINTYGGQTFYGYIYVCSDTTTATISVDQSYICPNDSITFSFGGFNNSTYDDGVVDMAIYKDGELFETIPGIKTSSLTKKFTEPGSYKAYITAYSNSGSSVNSDWVYWYVYNLTADLSIDKTKIAPNETILFSFDGYNNSTYDDGVVDMAIYKDDELFEVIPGIKDSSLAKEFTESGSYKAYITAYSNLGSLVDSDWVYWIVGSHITPGDATGDGEINLADVTLILKHIANWDVQIDTDIADVTGDDMVNLADVTLILKYIANWDVTFK